MFFGKFEHTIDDKGRVSVPARFRELLQASNDDRVVITNFFMGSTHCLDVYPYAAWIDLVQSVQDKPQFNQRLMHFQTYYFAHAHDCVLDKQGRVLVPQSLRDYAGLKRDVVFVPFGKKFRIFDRKQWNKVFSESEQAFMDHPEDLSELGI